MEIRGHQPEGIVNRGITRSRFTASEIRGRKERPVVNLQPGVMTDRQGDDVPVSNPGHVVITNTILRPQSGITEVYPIIQSGQTMSPDIEIINWQRERIVELKGELAKTQEDKVHVQESMRRSHEINEEKIRALQEKVAALEEITDTSRRIEELEAQDTMLQSAILDKLGLFAALRDESARLQSENERLREENMRVTEMTIRAGEEFDRLQGELPALREMKRRVELAAALIRGDASIEDVPDEGPNDALVSQNLEDEK